ncbi:MAG: DUF1080 domain-containing protein [Verrucomicrobiales bacterium]
MKTTAFSIASLALAAAPFAPAQDSTLAPIFDGKSFDGWEQRGGKAAYSVEDGAVVGRSVPNTPNSFMCTKKTYGDFLLEYEFKVDEELNSGVQIRSNSLPDYKNGQVHGYQVEIDPDTKRNRMWTGGIYDEGRRGWLNDLSQNEAARKAFKPGDWNAIKVRAVGDHIQTWLNGVPAADLVDSMTQEGFIGLQVHGVGKREDPLEIRWRNIQLQDLGRHVWKPIFDGKTLDGWEPGEGGNWEVKDGAIVGTSPASEKRHGILFFKDEVGDFTCRFKFRATKGNSGFYFRTEKVKGGVSVHGFQAEVDTTTDTGGLYETGGRAWVAKSDPEMMKKIYKPGEWSEMAVSARGGRVVVHVNGAKTVELKDDPGRAKGFLGLQLHGGQEMLVEFKDIELLVKE